MSYTVDIQVLDDGDAYSNTQVRLSIGETFFPGGRLGIYGEDGWTDEDGHATFEVPEYDDYSNKYLNVKIGGTWYGSWDWIKVGDIRLMSQRIVRLRTTRTLPINKLNQPTAIQ